MLTYTLEVAISWTLFYCIFYFLLRKETFFQYNRLYLLGTVLLGLAIPILPQVFTHSDIAGGPEQEVSFLEPITVTARNFSAQLEEIVITAEATSVFNVWKILIGIWWIGAVIALARLGFGLLKIYSLYRKGIPINERQYVLLETEAKHLPFSFFNILFWSNHFIADPIEKRKILDHELVHIQKGHSYDNILINVLLIPFWWIPPIYAYKNALSTLHEYEADAAVTKETPVNEYSDLLLQYANTGIQLSLTHSFAFTQLKNRIVMMTQKKSKPIQKLKYLALLPVAFILMSFFSGNKISPKISDSNPMLESNIGDPIDREVVKKVLTPLLVNMSKNGDAGLSAFSNKLNEITTNHPESIDAIFEILSEISEENHIEKYTRIGDPIIDVENIKLSSESILRDTNKIELNEIPESELGDVFKVVDQMPIFEKCPGLVGEEARDCGNMKMLEYVYSNISYPAKARDNGIQGTVIIRFVVDKTGKIVNPEIVRGIGGGAGEEVLRVVNSFPTWEPGIHEGNPVNVYFNLPVKFKLEDDEKSAEIAEQPRLSGCEEFETLDEKISCSQTKMLMQVYTNIKYPELARENGIEGVSVLKFDVGVDGKIKNPVIKKFIGGDCEEAILEMFEIMKATTTWIPAKTTDGEIVEAEVILPIKFKLEGKEPTEESAQKIQPLALKQYKLFPNPASNEVNLTFEPVNKDELKLEVFDASGKLMMRELLGVVSDRQILTLDSKGWAAGTYLIRIVGVEQIFLDQVQIVR